MTTSREKVGPIPEQPKRVLTPAVRLERLYERVQNEPLLAHLRYQRRIIKGHGNEARPFAMVIIEMPEANDENLGIPLTGPGGIVLHEMLGLADLKRSSHTFVTPVVKYRTYADREATKAETAAFLPYLKEEIAIVGPQYLVTCGRYVNKLFFPRRKLVDITGKILSWDGYFVLPTLSPAQAAIDPARRREMAQTFRMLGELA